MVVTLNNYLALGFPEINGVPVGEAGTLNTAGEDFKYTPTPAECEYCAAIYADSLPKGRLWEAFTVNGTFNHSFAQSVGAMIAVMFGYVAYLRRELNPYTTTDLIQEWEQSVGLPDECSLQGGGDLQSRRQQVITRLAKTPIVLAGEIEQAAKVLTGYDIKVIPRRQNILGSQLDNARLDLAQLGVGNNRFVFDVFINYRDVTALGEGVLDTQKLDTTQRYPRAIECLINRLKPANSLAFYHYNHVLYNLVKG